MNLGEISIIEIVRPHDESNADATLTQPMVVDHPILGIGHNDDAAPRSHCTAASRNLIVVEQTQRENTGYDTLTGTSANALDMHAPCVDGHLAYSGEAESLRYRS